MRGKINQVEVDEDRYGYGRPLDGNAGEKTRLDLNDLLKRIKDQKKTDKKTNLLIFSGAACVALVVVLILSL